MDGRAQKPVTEYLQKNFSVDYVDMITEPGPCKILSEGHDTTIIESIKKRVEISVKKHGAQIIAVVAHYACAGNPVNDDAQQQQLQKAIDVIHSWEFPVKKVIALWLDEDFKPSIIN